MAFKSLKEATKFHANEWEQFCSLKKPDYQRMSEINNGFGKIVKSFQVQVEAAKLNKQKADLSF